MKYRRKLKKSYSKKKFTRTAKRVHRKNGRGRPMRGGIRL